MIDVIQHFRDGGEVEYCRKSGSCGWSLAIGPVWDFHAYYYRKKPEKKTRLMTAEELKGRWLKNKEGVFTFVGCVMPVNNLIWWPSDDNDQHDRCIERWFGVQYLIDDGWTLEDGSPLMKEVE